MRFWGRGGDRPDAGEKSGKNAASEAAPPPPMEVYDEQEGFRVYKPEVGRLLGWRGLGCRFRRVGGLLSPPPVDFF